MSDYEYSRTRPNTVRTPTPNTVAIL
jgi:hypothetical protein